MNSDLLILGTTVYAGDITAPVRVISTDGDYASIQAGEIIVAPFVKPDAFLYLKGVAGMIVDEGGVMSHAAKYAQEHKIPCIVATKTAVEDLNTGDVVNLQAGEGTATVVE